MQPQPSKARLAGPSRGRAADAGQGFQTAAPYVQTAGQVAEVRRTAVAGGRAYRSGTNVWVRKFIVAITPAQRCNALWSELVEEVRKCDRQAANAARRRRLANAGSACESSPIKILGRVTQMGKKTVVVEGGNIYTVGDSSGTFYVRRGGFYGIDIGRTRSLDDALSLIKSHSGRQIRSIS